jgi:hypothetical protein
MPACPFPIGVRPSRNQQFISIYLSRIYISDGHTKLTQIRAKIIRRFKIPQIKTENESGRILEALVYQRRPAIKRRKSFTSSCSSRGKIAWEDRWRWRRDPSSTRSCSRPTPTTPRYRLRHRLLSTRPTVAATTAQAPSPIHGSRTAASVRR